MGGDDSEEEFLQIKSVVPNGPAWLDSRLKTGETEQIRTNGPGGTETHPAGPETMLFTTFLPLCASRILITVFALILFQIG